MVRDDLLEGGTKRRVLRAVLASRPAQEFVYAATAQGYGQLALALAARDVGRRATIFIAGRARCHPLTQAAQAAGATIHEVWQRPGFLPNVARQAALYTAQQDGRAELLPLGFNMPEFRAGLTALAQRLPVRPTEMWSVLGSGALLQSLQAAWPGAQAHGVQVGRIVECAGADIHIAPEAFASKAQMSPPFPSAPQQDAKVWRFVQARKGALFWNVAG